MLWLPWGRPERVGQSYEYHLEVASERTPGANLPKVLSTMGDRDRHRAAAAVLAIGAILLHRRARPPAATSRGSRPPTCSS